MTPNGSKRLMLDPSFLLSSDGFQWLEGNWAGNWDIAVPSTFFKWLEHPARHELLRQFVTPDDQAGYEERSERLSYLLNSGNQFSLNDAPLLDDAVASVLRELMARPEATGELWADEWVFLWSNSWLLSKLHHPLDAFRDAGAAVVEYGRSARDRMISLVMPNEQLPAAVTPELLGKVAAKWLVVGGTGAAGTLLGPLGGALGPAAIPLIQAFDP